MGSPGVKISCRLQLMRGKAEDFVFLICITEILNSSTTLRKCKTLGYYVLLSVRSQ